MIAFIQIEIAVKLPRWSSAGVQDGEAWNDLESYMVGNLSSTAIHVVLAQHEERRSKGSEDVAPLAPKATGKRAVVAVSAIHAALSRSCVGDMMGTDRSWWFGGMG